MGLSSFLKNLLGKAKDSGTINLDSQTENIHDQTDESGNLYIEKVETFVEEAYIKVKKTSEPIFEDAVEYANQAKDIISEYVEKATESMNDIIDSVKEITNETDVTERIVYDTVVDSSEKEITETDE